MTRQIVLIMRHAKSEWGTPNRSDFDRPLAARGRTDALNMARWLRVQDFVPHCIQSSPARRAAETARIVAKELHELPIIWQRGLYLAELGELLTIMSDPPSACWLLIGHNPGLESLIEYCDPLFDSQLGNEKRLPTAALYAISLDNNASSLPGGCGKVVCHQRPKWLANGDPRD